MEDTVKSEQKGVWLRIFGEEKFFPEPTEQEKIARKKTAEWDEQRREELTGTGFTI